jgi:hypothetical protein
MFGTPRHGRIAPVLFEGEGGGPAAGDQKAGQEDKGGADGKPADAGGKGGSDAKGGAKDGDGKPVAGAPEKYELTVPEGQEYLEADDLQAIEVIARGKGWTNEQAQAAVNEHVEAVESRKARFLEESKQDPVYGGDKLDQTVLLANKALDRLHPKGDLEGDRFRKLLSRSGYGNNIAVLAHLAKLGKMMGEDGGLPGSGHSGDKKTAEEIMYGGTTSKT